LFTNQGLENGEGEKATSILICLSKNEVYCQGMSRLCQKLRAKLDGFCRREVRANLQIPKWWCCEIEWAAVCYTDCITHKDRLTEWNIIVVPKRVAVSATDGRDASYTERYTLSKGLIWNYITIS